MNGKYIVIAEYKVEGALARETYLSKATEKAAYDRMKALEADPRVIRVAIARLVYEAGHEDLLPKTEETP